MQKQSALYRPIYAKLPPYNPYVGTFHHAPSAGNRGAIYFTTDIVQVSELEARKKLRHHPLTGTFHILPGYYDPLHRLNEVRREAPETNAQTLAQMLKSEKKGLLSGSLSSGMLRVMSERNMLVNAEEVLRSRRYSAGDSGSIKNSKDTFVELASNQIEEDIELLSVSQSEDSAAATSWEKSEEKMEMNIYVDSKYPEVDAEPEFADDVKDTRGMRLGSQTGFISTGKGIFRRMHAPVDQSVAEGNMAAEESLSMGSETHPAASEYTQEAPRTPANPFMARRLTDGEKIRIMSVNRCGSRDGISLRNFDSNENHVRADGIVSALPNPYFIHEKAVTEQYKLCGEDQLGDGAYAVVKPAFCRSNNRPVAIKQIHKLYLRTEEAKAAVEREIEIHLRLQHPHIVRLHEVYETKDFLYLVMAKANKGNLKALLQRKRKLPEAFAAKLVQQIVRGVYFLHDRGVVHCDLKPDNVLLTDAKSSLEGSEHGKSSKAYMDPHADVKICDLQVKICDFGLSVKVPDVRFYKLTGDVHKVPFTTITGTLGYIAPEFFLERPFGKPVDLWSIGIMIYEMLTGYLPFYPARSCVEESANFDDTIWHSISASGKDLIRKLLERDAIKRLTAEQALAHEWFDTAAFAL